MSRLGTAVLVAALTTVSLTTEAVATMVPSTPAGVPIAAPAGVTVEASSLVYTVENGDYLVGIAAKLGVRFRDLLAVNKMDIASSIHPGDKLAVPVGGTLPVEAAPVAAVAPAVPTAPVVAPATEYVVKNGDSLFRIASNNGVTFRALLAANKLTNTSVIFPGAKLIVPPATLPIPAAAVVPAAAAVAAAVPVVAAVPVDAAAPVAAAVATNTEYIVKNGDYLVGIATSNGVTLKALLGLNKMTVTSAIFAGTKLAVPPATLPIPAAPQQAAPIVPVADGAVTTQQTAIATVMTFLHGELGKGYLFNSAGPDTYDCSGLVVAAFRQVGINLPHQSLLLSQKGTNVDWRAVDIQAGDLIFQIGVGKTIISHVGIAISSNQWVASARTGDVVKISTIPIDDKIQAVRRIIN